MKSLILAFATVLVAFAFHAQQPAAAAGSLPWCASTEAGSVDCAYISLEQCLNSTRGSGNSCGMNFALPATNAFAQGSIPAAKRALRQR
jgi:hypothetical protein